MADIKHKQVALNGILLRSESQLPIKNTGDSVAIADEKVNRVVGIDMPEKERTKIKFLVHDAGTKRTVQVPIRKDLIM